MSESTEPRAALVSVEDQGTILAIIDLDKENTGNDEIREAFI
jgi:hypothetical protein